MVMVCIECVIFIREKHVNTPKTHDLDTWVQQYNKRTQTSFHFPRRARPTRLRTVSASQTPFETVSCFLKVLGLRLLQIWIRFRFEDLIDVLFLRKKC